MRSSHSLYFAGHNFNSSLAALLLLYLILALQGGLELPLPWLNSFQSFTLGSMCAFGCAVATLHLFRNELSRLEAANSRRWLPVDLSIVGSLWIIPWFATWINLFEARHAYAICVTTSLGFALGSVMKSDSMILSLVSILLVQTALWTTVENSPWRHLMFIVADTPVPLMLLISLASLGLSALCITRFKSRAA